MISSRCLKQIVTKNMQSGQNPHFVVVSTYQDPIGGWTNNMTGVNGLCVGIGIGFLRHLHIKKDFVIDVICADFVTNTTLASIWLAAEKYAANGSKVVPAPEVYNVTNKGYSLTTGILIFFLVIFWQFSSNCDRFSHEFSFNRVRARQ